MRKELNIFGSSVLFFSRIPLPFKVPYQKENMAKILTWFPLVGLFVGGVAVISWYLAQLLLPHSVAIILSMLATILATGAFHEDGLGDVCDGFGGGYNKERILSIMKDSSVGAYAAIGIVLVLLMKLVVLTHINPSQFIGVILLGHSLSRASVLLNTQFWSYARSEDSKAKLPSQKLSPLRFIMAMLFGLAPLCLIPIGILWLIPLLAFAVALLMAMYYNKHIGGYTGDCLGATQQVVEVCIYLAFLALL